MSGHPTVSPVSLSLKLGTRATLRSIRFFKLAISFSGYRIRLSCLMSHSVDACVVKLRLFRWTVISGPVVLLHTISTASRVLLITYSVLFTSISPKELHNQAIERRRWNRIEYKVGTMFIYCNTSNRHKGPICCKDTDVSI